VGAAIVERVIRAYKTGQKYKIIVCIPAVPGFPGDLHDEKQNGILAIMNLQYQSICRGGHSIMEKLQQEGVKDAGEYIRFFNLRNYDRINNARALQNKPGDIAEWGSFIEKYGDVSDSISSCYMLGGPPLSSMPWVPGDKNEMDAFVSEQLYIHSKCLIADDRVVIIGSANLNDRSLLGDHDSEIAVVVEDASSVASKMDSQPYAVSKFATTLRRKLFRKHMGLLGSQDLTKLETSPLQVVTGPDSYDWGSQADLAVEDPLSPEFDLLWNGTAKTNTEILTQVFSPVPCNQVRCWEDYELYYGELFGSSHKSAKYNYGHVVKKNFPGGITQMKEILGQVRGTLVEMPLDFLCEVNGLVRKGWNYNRLTEAIYS
jgi:phospholipase D1/2